MTETLRSFAKVNLGLRIGARRADGFHDLLTVYQTIALHDVIRVSVGRGKASRGKSKPGKSDSAGPVIEIRCDDPRVPCDETNTCYRIAEKALAALFVKTRPPLSHIEIKIEIEKRLPVQGGLAGGSSNAVATLIGLQRALKRFLSPAENLRIAAEVGSDLPLFLVGGTVLGVGRGEQVYPLPDLPAMACVVVTPEAGVSTPKAFAEWDRTMVTSAAKAAGSDGGEIAALKRGATRECATQFGEEELQTAGLRSAGQPGAAVPTRPEEGARPHAGKIGSKLTMNTASDRINRLGREMSAWLSAAFHTELYNGAPSAGTERRGRVENPLLDLVRAGIANDFEEVVFPEYPELREGKRALESAGAKYASLSGSGSALFGLFVSREAASRAASRLRKQGWIAQETTTLTRRAYWKKVLN